MERTSEALVSFARDVQFAELPPEVVRVTEARVLDTLGVSIASATHERIRELLHMYGDITGNATATVLGTGTETRLEYAAFLNAGMARWLDFNDTYSNQHTGTHPSDIIPPLLAIAEVTDSSGPEIIEAIVLGYEIQCRGLDTGIFWNNGFDYAAWGAYATALAAGKLFGFSAEQLTNALGIAANANNALRVVRSGNISMWKGLSQPYAIHNAIQAVQMADAGITGPENVFEGTPGGVYDAIANESVRLDGLGDGDSDIITETAIKPYCSGYGAIPAIEATTSLINSHQITPTDIETIDVLVVNRLLETYGSPEKWGPDLTRETADHSIPYCVAIAIREGTVYPEHYHETHLTNNEVYELMDRITVTGNDELTTYEQAHPRELPTEVTITASGATFSTRVTTPRGHPRNPMDRSELEEKFRSLTDTQLSSNAQETVIDESYSLADRDSIEPLLAPFRSRDH